jgi:hypothetical protein
MKKSTASLALCLLLPFGLIACERVEPDDDDASGIDVLGNDGHTVDDVTIDVLADSGDGLDVPRDLGFNPEGDMELWIVNRADDSTTTLFDTGTDDQEAVHIVDPYAMHFMEEVSAIAFGAPGTFGTTQESNNTYNGQAPANNFMGPSLWSSDMDVYGLTNQAAFDAQGFDLGSHLDMLHQSPFTMGMAWDHDNVYWVFDGEHEAIVRYDFAEDHGPGWDDHSDGVIGFYATGDVKREEDVPSHMELDRETGLLYIADTGNNRIAVLDTLSGERGNTWSGNRVFEPGTDVYDVDDADLVTLVEGEDFNMREPSGLAIHGDHVYVSDNRTGVITAFTKDGEMVDWLDMEVDRGSLMGMEFDEAGNLYVVDAEADELLRITP